MLRLVRPVHRHADVRRLLLGELGQPGTELLEVEPSDLLIDHALGLLRVVTSRELLSAEVLKRDTKTAFVVYDAWKYSGDALQRHEDFYAKGFAGACSAGEDWALLGDAAGFADPVTGEGIYYASCSAELLAQAYLSGDLSSYEGKWRADFGAELRRAAQMRRRFYGNFWGAPFTERMIEFARGHRGVKRVLGDLVAGEQGYTDLKKKLVKRALRPV